ncbi:hypothetical protein NDU88_002275 [Pleurodeles waltl]|uniref:Uncharacterized protein n=1 Tax=Pleurodeles waltl TaxID=8319 RepID=A0AAV7SDV7_PLEWA|nr:hypothetical protein NDU88_002275 [Pleurodeles waltl]
MRSGRLEILAEGKVKPLKPQRRTQGKGKCSAKHSAPCPQSSRQEQLVTPLTPFQLYFKQTEFANKADFLKDPAAAFFSNPDTVVGLPTPLTPQPLITGQRGPGLSTNQTQQLGVALPGQETSKVQAPEELSDPLLQGQQINLSFSSSPIAHKHLQAGRIVTMAQVHAQERETSLGAHLQVLMGNPSSSKLPISTGNETEVHNDTGYVKTHPQSTPIPWSNSNTHGNNERLVIGSEVITGLEDSWLQSLSITNNKDLGEALDLKTFDLMNPKDQKSGHPLVVESIENSITTHQQERTFNPIFELSSEMSKIQSLEELMVKSSSIASPSNNIPSESINREILFKNPAHADHPTCEMGDLTRLHTSLLNALHTSTVVLNMQSDKLDLQMDLMKVMATCIAGINHKLDPLAFHPTEQNSNLRLLPCNCGPILDKLCTLPQVLIEILQEVKAGKTNEAISRNQGTSEKTPAFGVSSPAKKDANIQCINPMITDGSGRSTQSEQTASTNLESIIEQPAPALKPLTKRQKKRARKARKQTCANAINDNLYPIFSTLRQPQNRALGTASSMQISNSFKAIREGVVTSPEHQLTEEHLPDDSPMSPKYNMPHPTSQDQLNGHALATRLAVPCQGGLRAGNCIYKDKSEIHLDAQLPVRIPPEPPSDAAVAQATSSLSTITLLDKSQGILSSLKTSSRQRSSAQVNAGQVIVIPAGTKNNNLTPLVDDSQSRLNPRTGETHLSPTLNLKHPSREVATTYHDGRIKTKVTIQNTQIATTDLENKAFSSKQLGTLKRAPSRNKSEDGQRNRPMPHRIIEHSQSSHVIENDKESRQVILIPDYDSRGQQDSLNWGNILRLLAELPSTKKIMSPDLISLKFLSNSTQNDREQTLTLWRTSEIAASITAVKLQFEIWCIRLSQPTSPRYPFPLLLNLKNEPIQKTESQARKRGWGPDVGEVEQRQTKWGEKDSNTSVNPLIVGNGAQDEWRWMARTLNSRRNN